MAVIYSILSYIILAINPILSDRLADVLLNANNGRIVGGRDATEGEIPYIVSLEWVGDHWCGGSILSRKTILTAAHCVDGADSIPLKVRYNSLKRVSGGSIVNVSRIIVHPRYHPFTLDNDIAIIHLASSLVLDQVQANRVLLPEDGEDPPEGTEVVVSGWGRLSSSGQLAENLQTVTVSMISRERCREQYTVTGITDNMICAGDQGDKDACQGDSGGPLVHDGVIWGLTSWGPNGCALLDKAGIYTRIGNYIEWIQRNLY